MYACLAETHHLYSWQNDWGLLCATAVITLSAAPVGDQTQNLLIMRLVL